MEELINCENDPLTKATYRDLMQSQSKFHGHPSHGERKKNLKVDVKSEKIKESQNNPDQKEFDRRHHHFQCQVIPQSPSNNTAWDISQM